MAVALSAFGLLQPVFIPEDDGDVEVARLGIALPGMISPTGFGMDGHVRNEHVSPWRLSKSGEPNLRGERSGNCHEPPGRPGSQSPSRYRQLSIKCA